MAQQSVLPRLILRRTAATVPIVVGVSILTFWLLSLIPGNAAEQLLGSNATVEQVKKLEEALGLNEPAIARYWHWLTGAVTGDLGNSLVSGQPVVALIGERIGVTLEIAALALAVALAVAVPLAVVSARWPGSLADRFVSVVGLTGLSMANYVLALLLSLVFAVGLGWLPSLGYVPLHEDVLGNLRSLVLPVLAIAIPLMCFYMRFLRSDLVGELQREAYTDTARAKGVGPWRVLVGHALRNSSFGLVTLVGLDIGVLIGGTVITEQIFAIPGMGQLMLQAITHRDVPVLLGCVVLFATVAVLANLVVDLLYFVLDPRIRYGRR